MTTHDGPTRARIAPDSGSALEEIRDDHTSRKRFLRALGSGGAVAALGTVLAACGDDDEESTTATTPTETGMTGGSGSSGDVEILNYALTLEYLEAEFYRQVIASGAIEDPAVVAIAKKFGKSEEEHVGALEATIKDLGGTPVSAPATDFTSVLEGGPDVILETAATVENVGAAAYLNEAPRIQSPEILAAALSIHSVEARHAAALNALIEAGFQGDGPLSGSIPNGAFAVPLDMDAVMEKIQPFLA